MDTANKQFIAHAKQKGDGAWADPHLLEEHLQKVAKLAAEFSGTFSSSDWGLTSRSHERAD